MPKLRKGFGWLLLCVSPMGFAAQDPPPAPTTVKAPEQPSAALLEFVGDWNEDERQLIGMDTPRQQPVSESRKPREARRAP